jgi:hypothetical protein
VSGDSDLTFFAEVAFFEEVHQDIGVIEFVLNISTIFGSSADYRDTKEFTTIFVSNLSMKNATGDGESVELSVASVGVIQSKPLIKNM